MFLETILADALRGDDDDRKSPSAVAGRWRNRLGSTMELTVGDNHEIHGTYHAVMGEVNPKLPFPVIGFIEGEAVSFCVDFGRRGSVASWSGHHLHDEHGERLVTLWHLARPSRSPERSTSRGRCWPAPTSSYGSEPEVSAPGWVNGLGGGQEFWRRCSS